MGESAEEIYRRALSAAGDNGRLAMPPVHEWETFPFEGDIRVRALFPPVEAERPRRGEGGVGCWRCERGDSDAIWSDDRWLLTPMEKPSGLPVIVILQPRAHHDFDDLPVELARELGPLIQRVERAVRALGEIGRVHVCRWGDGSEHLHFWLMARPARLPQSDRQLRRDLGRHPAADPRARLARQPADDRHGAHLGLIGRRRARAPGHVHPLRAANGDCPQSRRATVPPCLVRQRPGV